MKCRVVQSVREKYAATAMEKDIAYTFGRPVQAVIDAGGTLLLGHRATKGPFKGRRLRPVGVEPITPHEFGRLRRKAGRGFVVPKATRVRHEGDTFHFKTKYGRGGLVGATKRHPVIVGGLTLAGIATLMAMRRLGPGRQEVPQTLPQEPTPQAWG
jgi:hypothetical protein